MSTISIKDLGALLLGAELELGDLVVLVDDVELRCFLLLLQFVDPLLRPRLLLEVLLDVFLVSWPCAVCK